jgi:hypothetical protein
MADLITSSFSESDASNTAVSGVSIAEGCPPSNVNDAQRATLGAVKRLVDRLGPTLTAGGTANALTLTYAVGPAAYTQGEVFSFIAAATNTGAATLNVSGLGAKSITKNGATALQGGEMVTGAVVTVMYDGTQFQLISNNVTEATAFWGGTSGGSANAQTVSLTPAPGAYYAGMVVTFLAGATNTGATTLNCNSLGAKSIFVANAACVGGELLSGKAYTVVCDGTQFQMLSPQSTQRGALIGVQYFTASGAATYTPTAGTNSIIVEVIGAGGGGGGAPTTGAGQVACGGSGGGGGYARKRITSSFSGVTVTVGAKGTGGTAGANPGNAGGTSSFGALVSATGGGAGSAGSAGSPPVTVGCGSNGSGSSGDINLEAIGGIIIIQQVSTTVQSSPPGYAPYYGGIGVGYTTSQGGFGGRNKGSGGTGGINSASQASSRAGGDGTDGMVIVWEYN